MFVKKSIFWRQVKIMKLQLTYNFEMKISYKIPFYNMKDCMKDEMWSKQKSTCWQETYSILIFALKQFFFIKKLCWTKWFNECEEFPIILSAWCFCFPLYRNEYQKTFYFHNSNFSYSKTLAIQFTPNIIYKIL